MTLHVVEVGLAAVAAKEVVQTVKMSASLGRRQERNSLRVVERVLGCPRRRLRVTCCEL